MFLKVIKKKWLLAGGLICLGKLTLRQELLESTAISKA